MRGRPLAAAMARKEGGPDASTAEKTQMRSIFWEVRAEEKGEEASLVGRPGEKRLHTTGA